MTELEKLQQTIQNVTETKVGLKKQGEDCLHQAIKLFIEKYNTKVIFFNGGDNPIDSKHDIFCKYEPDEYSSGDAYIRSVNFLTGSCEPDTFSIRTCDDHEYGIEGEIINDVESYDVNIDDMELAVAILEQVENGQYFDFYSNINSALACYYQKTHKDVFKVQPDEVVTIGVGCAEVNLVSITFDSDFFDIIEIQAKDEESGVITDYDAEDLNKASYYVEDICKSIKKQLD